MFPPPSEGRLVVEVPYINLYPTAYTTLLPTVLVSFIAVRGWVGAGNHLCSGVINNRMLNLVVDYTY